MTRVSQQEMYDDKDIITQICKLKDLVATGTYKDVDVQDDGAGNLVFTFTDQRDDTEVFTIPVKQISSVTSSQSGSTVTMRITWADGTYNDYTWTAGGDVTTNTAQTITASKTFEKAQAIYGSYPLRRVSGTGGKWKKIATSTQNDRLSEIDLIGCTNNNLNAIGKIWVNARRNLDTPQLFSLFLFGSAAWNLPDVRVTLSADGTVTLWGKTLTNLSTGYFLRSMYAFSAIADNGWTPSTDDTEYDEPTLDDYSYVVSPTGVLS